MIGVSNQIEALEEEDGEEVEEEEEEEILIGMRNQIEALDEEEGEVEEEEEVSAMITEAMILIIKKEDLEEEMDLSMVREAIMDFLGEITTSRKT